MVDYYKKAKRDSKIQIRFAMLIGGALLYCMYWYVMQNDNGMESNEFSNHRYLLDKNCTENVEWKREPSQDDICIGFGAESCKKFSTEQMPLILVVVLGLLYLFVGIAIVCDELFVPALEIVAENLQLSDDVAGATLMAAGGSAPELATSFVGVFKRSDVGFGTIVGSAVFNVLFVIGMCVMFTPAKFSPLELTWWPLFRDCTYYVLTLATLAAFMSDGQIELWEALVQFLMYFGYVGMMSQSEKLEKWITDNFINSANAQVVPEEGDGEKNELAGNVEKGEGDGKGDADGGDDASGGAASFVRPSTFRVGILQLLTSKQSIVETAGIAFVAKIKGDVNEVFDKLDANQNGQLEPDELRMCLKQLGTPEDELSEDKIDACMAAMDPERKGYVTKASFTIWYTGNEQRLKNETREIFNKYDTDKANTIKRTDVIKFMSELGHIGRGNEDRIEDAATQIKSTCKDPDFLTYDDFTEWYEHSLFWEAEKAAAEQAAESQESMWESLLSGAAELTDSDVPFMSKFNYCICAPLSLLCCLIPDCRPPGMEFLAPYTLLMSVVMIAFFAIIMVELAEIFGKSLGIPDVVMGLTILAAGTSVPDLLSSVIVAQQGQGDMAVSSSIGSNIFDVAFGLPLPWLVFNLVSMGSGCNCPVIVEAEGLMISLLILLGMVAAIVVIIHMSGWKMTHNLGYAMFLLYFIYVGVSLAITPADSYKPDDCSPFNMFG
jgi:K+-dependent Na+/Ca+ exchanger-like protein